MQNQRKRKEPESFSDYSMIYNIIKSRRRQRDRVREGDVRKGGVRERANQGVDF